MASHLSSLRHLLTITTMLWVCCTTLLGQVTIKEKVTIDPKSSSQRNTNCVNCGGSMTIIMQRKGTVQLYYSYAQRLGSSIPTSARLLVHRLRADTVMTDSILGRFPSPQPQHNPSNCPDTAKDYEWVYTNPPQPFSAMNAQLGDTVQLYYITDLYPPDGLPDTLTMDPAFTSEVPPYGWDIRFDLHDNCRVLFDEQVDLFITTSDTTIMFVQPSSKIVYPRYVDHNNRTDKNDTLDLQVQLRYINEPLKNYWVRVDSSVLVDSGGHSHDGSRPLGTLLVPRTPPPGYDLVNTFTRQTDSLGNLNFRYVASQFGGIERIKAVRLSDTTTFDTVRITTKVSALVGLPAGSSYYLVGGTSQHHDGSNHYGTQTLVGDIQSIATTFVASYPNWKLRINDMSLIYGGGFDINGHWEQDITPPDCRLSGYGHCEHREGLSGDISFTARNPSNQDVPLTQSQKRKLVDIITEITPDPKVHSNHYHVRAER